MALYTLSSFITTIKEDAEVEDLPLPVTDNQIIDRLKRKSMVDFSIIYPYTTVIRIGEMNLNKKSTDSMHTFYEYIIPKWAYADTTLLSVSRVDVARPNGYSDFFIPNANWSTPDAIISAMADVRMAAGVASALAKAPTFQFVKPNLLRLWNGWAGGLYEVELNLAHDMSLTTVPETSFGHLEELATLDLKSFLYSKLKRKENTNAGVGEFELKVAEFQGAAEEYRQLVKEWRETNAFHTMHIYRY